MAKFVYGDRSELQYIKDPGIYQVTIAATKFELSQKGDDTMTLSLEADSGERINDTFYFTEKAGWRMDVLLKKLGIGQGLTKGQTVELDEGTFNGATINIEVFEESYTNAKGEAKTVMKVKRYLTDSELPAKAKPAAAAPLRAAKVNSDNIPY